MLLNAEEIKSKGLLIGTKDKHFKDASYNLTTGKIITPEGKEVDTYWLPPRGIVLVVSGELFNLPADIIGYTTVKNSLSIQGVMAINVGLIDPLWNEPISSALINFGSTKALIQEGEEFLRMTFHEFKKVDTKKLYSLKTLPVEDTDQVKFDEYLVRRKKNAIPRLSDTFLSLDQIKDEIVMKVFNKLLVWFTIFATGIGILAFGIPYLKKLLSNRTSSETIQIQNDVKELYNKLNTFELKIDSVKHELIDVELENDGK